MLGEVPGKIYPDQLDKIEIKNCIASNHSPYYFYQASEVEWGKLFQSEFVTSR